MPEQLVFDLPVRESRARGDFFVSQANQLAVARLDVPETWPNRKLVLVGPEGAGKTHLAHVWAEQAGALRLKAGDLPGLDVPGVASGVVVDGVDALTAAEEEALFHLHNHLGTMGLPFLIAARTPPALWVLTLPDLKSRMEATDSVRIDAPDDALLTAVLLKMFDDRQLEITPAAIQWMVRNTDRSFAEARRAVSKLDKAALAKRRAVTRALAVDVLG